MNATTAIEPGLHYSVPDETYRQWPAVSQTELKDSLRSPALCKWNQDHPAEPTEAMALGSAVHAAILEPERFARDYAVAPACDRRTKAGKETWAAFVADNADKHILKADKYDLCHALRRAVEMHDAAAALLACGNPEVSALWVDPVTGLDCKARLDWLADGAAGTIVDIKTCEDASPGGFARQAWRYGYHIQADYYLYGFTLIGLAADPETGRNPAFIIIAIEKRPPHLIGVYRMGDDSLNLGHDLAEQALATYKRCVVTGEWPGYSDQIEPLDVPTWAFNRKEDDNGRPAEVEIDTEGF